MIDLCVGPFSEIVTMENLHPFGPLKDDDLVVIKDAAIHLRNGMIQKIGSYNSIKKESREWIEIEGPAVALPGFIDAHTHLCWAGSRSKDYALRLQGISYESIAARGGGILDTVNQTRQASLSELVEGLFDRIQLLSKQGVTTCEVKSGYGLTVDDEIKILTAIQKANSQLNVDLIPTCLAAHVKPPEFDTNQAYLTYLEEHLFPKLIDYKLASRLDIFVDQVAFTPDEARPFLKKAQKKGFAIAIHADQFNRGGGNVAAELRALSADHLDVSTREDFEHLKQNKVIPIVLPGCSLGLGTPFAPAREILDAGLPLVIASDWNPGSAPLGYLLLEAALMGAAQRLTMAETFAAITIRAARALQLSDRGELSEGKRGDIVVFPCQDHREILYHQGSLYPELSLNSKKMGYKNG